MARRAGVEGGGFSRVRIVGGIWAQKPGVNKRKPRPEGVGRGVRAGSRVRGHPPSRHRGAAIA